MYTWFNDNSPRRKDGPHNKQLGSSGPNSGGNNEDAASSRRRRSTANFIDESTPSPPPDSPGLPLWTWPVLAGSFVLILVVVGALYWRWSHKRQVRVTPEAPAGAAPGKRTNAVEKHYGGMTRDQYEVNVGSEQTGFEKLDANGNGVVSGKEWLEAFESIDKDGDGTIDREEWENMFGKNSKFGGFDDNGDDKIDFEEWRAAFRNKHKAAGGGGNKRVDQSMVTPKSSGRLPPLNKKFGAKAISEAQQSALREELSALKLGGLSKRAIAAGVDSDALEVAQDLGDKSAIIELIVQTTRTKQNS